MKKTIVTIIAAAISLCGLAQEITPNRQNPVIEGIADCGVIKYAGKYYIGGVSTFGDFLVSEDLVKWDDRVHVFDLDNEWTHGTGAKNNQVHANDMSYSNGKFHLLFSVNWWGRDKHIVHITHAESSSVTGPYKEVRNDRWFENRIDPMVFRDEDGRLYLYMVKFTNGNVIWGRELNQDFTFRSEPVLQFDSQVKTWEAMDNRVAEGPFVIKRHGRYYMMYNANHTGVSYGNYRLGVCEAPSPLAFNSGGKYSAPVVGPNTEPLADNHQDWLRYDSDGYNPLDLSADTLKFSLHAVPSGKMWMKICHRGVEVFLNGVSLNPGSNIDYSMVQVPEGLLRQGENVISLKRGERSSLADLALYEMGDENPDELLITPGQPNLVRGPNGWEWWLVYMANRGWRRHQFIDRIYFVNDRLTVDGIIGPETPGFHPEPAGPQFSGKTIKGIGFSGSWLLEATFKSSLDGQGFMVGDRKIVLPSDMEKGVSHIWRMEKNSADLTVWIDGVLVADHEKINGGKVAWIGGEQAYDIEYVQYNDGWDEWGSHFSGWKGLKADENGLIPSGEPAFKGEKASDYEFSAHFVSPGNDSGKYGVYAAFADNRNYVKVEIDPSSRSVLIDNCIGGKNSREAIPLLRRETVFPDVRYSDGIEKQYHFKTPTVLSSISIPKADAFEKGRSYEDIAGIFDISYLDGNIWKPIEYKEIESKDKSRQAISFSPVRTKALSFINKTPTDIDHHIYKIQVTEDFSSEYQIRIDKRGSTLHVFVDNREVATLLNPGVALSRIGLTPSGSDVRLADNLYYTIY